MGHPSVVPIDDKSGGRRLLANLKI